MYVVSNSGYSNSFQRIPDSPWIFQNNTNTIISWVAPGQIHATSYEMFPILTIFAVIYASITHIIENLYPF